MKKNSIAEAVSQAGRMAAIEQALEQYEADVLQTQRENKKTTGKRVTAFDMMARQPWAMLPDALEVVASIAQHNNESPEAVAAKLGRPLQNTRTVSVRDGVAVVPVTGPVFRYANLFTEISGATSLEVLAREFSSAVNDPAISAIVLEMDTPGGQASGIAEFAQQVRAADKPVIAYVDGMAASAGYWIAAAADEIVTNKTGMVGSIGAVIGVDAGKSSDVVEIVSSQSPKKRPDVTTEDGRSQIQARIDAMAQVFVEDVAAYRGVSAETVLADFGQGDMRMGEESVGLGMADRVSTLEEVIAGLSGTTTGASQTMTTKAMATPAADNQPAITREYLAENHTDVVQAIEHDAAAASAEKATATERQRIQGILAIPLANVYGDVVSAAIENGDEPAQLAVAILAEEGKSQAQTMANQKADAPDAVVAAIEQEEGVSADAPIDVRARSKWDKDEKLRAEFGGNFDTYLAYFENEANVKVLGKK